MMNILMRLRAAKKLENDDSEKAVKMSFRLQNGSVALDFSPLSTLRVCNADLGLVRQCPAMSVYVQKTEKSKHEISVADPGCLSRIPDLSFFYPGSEFFPSRIRIKEFKYLNPKNCF
jgi:hypothetical protein